MPKALNRAELAERIDRLGALRKQLHVLGDEEKSVSDEVREALAARASRQASGEAYRAELVDSETTEISDVPGLAKAAGKRLLEIVTIRLSEARRVLGQAVLEKFTRKVPAERLTVKPVS
ncbi:MAG TPA: hypothetical protein PK082_10890 [Phycisphaerae bacterium]|nr:hypothetical protein [Phycisphaerae bacterium]